MESILTSVKKVVGIAEEYTHFDPDIILHTNTVFMILNQLGVGPDKGFRVVDADDEWGTFLEDEIQLEGVKTFVFLKVKLIFDPPLSAAALAALERSIDELEWRIAAVAEQLRNEATASDMTKSVVSVAPVKLDIGLPTQTPIAARKFDTSSVVVENASIKDVRKKINQIQKDRGL